MHLAVEAVEVEVESVQVLPQTVIDESDDLARFEAKPEAAIERLHPPANEHERVEAVVGKLTALVKVAVIVDQ